MSWSSHPSPSSSAAWLATIPRVLMSARWFFLTRARMSGLVEKNQALFIAASLLASIVTGQEAQWIWSPEHTKEGVPTGEMCHFRKILNLRYPEGGQIAIAADDQYELFVNGRRIGSGEATKKLDEYDITRHLSRGVNVVAVRVLNTTANTAALVARVTIKDRGEWFSYSSDASWRTATRPLPLWNTTLYNDRGWAPAQAFGALAKGDRVVVRGGERLRPGQSVMIANTGAATKAASAAAKPVG